jgi:hypothetical protein
MGFGLAIRYTAIAVFCCLQSYISIVAAADVFFLGAGLRSAVATGLVWVIAPNSGLPIRSRGFITVLIGALLVVKVPDFRMPTGADIQSPYLGDNMRTVLTMTGFATTALFFQFITFVFIYIGCLSAWPLLPQSSLCFETSLDSNVATSEPAYREHGSHPSRFEHNRKTPRCSR